MSIEESLLGNSQFLGRDGFRWWIGQVAPREVQDDQLNEGKGWSNRYKVRIMGYHPFTEDLKTSDLPWAIALLPTTAGSGAANYAKSTVLQQGDVCFGFFLDGDEAQVPCILGHFSRTSGIADDAQFKAPLVPYTGVTDSTPKNPKTKVENDKGDINQDNEQNSSANPTNSSGGEKDTGKDPVDQADAGIPIIAPTTCAPTVVSRMAQAMETMASRIETLSLTGMALEAEISAVGDQIETMANPIVGAMMDATYTQLETVLEEGMDKLYNETFGKVFEQMGDTPQSHSLAHDAGKAAQVGQLPAIKNAENALSCVANKVIEGLRGTVTDMLKDLLASGLGIAGCVSANLISNFINKMVGAIEDGMKGPFSMLKDILGTGLNIADFLRSSAFVLEDFSGFLDCGQTNKDKCPPINKYEQGGGPMEKGPDPYGYIMGQMQKTSTPGQGLSAMTGGIGGVLSAVQGITSGDFLSDLVPPNISKSLGSANRISGLIDELSAGGGCLGGSRDCGNAKVEIFGGGGIGAVGNVVMGNFIENSGLQTLTDSINRTGSIIGVDLKLPGSGFKSPPAIRIADKCGLGHGAHGHAVINDKGEVEGVVIDTVGTGYPVVTDPDTNVGVIKVIVENPGTGYTPGDQIDEDVFVTQFPTGLPVIDRPITSDDPTVDPDDPDKVADPYTKLVPETQRVRLKDVKNKPVFDLVVNPETGGIEAVRVLNILRFEAPPVLKIVTESGYGAVIRPVFGEIPPAVQGEVMTVIDCVSSNPTLGKI